MFFFNNSAKANYENLFYDFSIKSINGEEINFADYKNKAILIVNVASYCGFTKQYNDLQNLWETYKDQGLIIIGIPSNSFGQEKNNESEIKNFCEVNFNITFPLTSIYDVKGKNAHDIYKWAEKNYGKKSIPKWNFYKILINKEGKIEETFSSLTNPNSKKVKKIIEDIILR
tara:strand:- start:280 stop:795 length:516 start_codon:yes stop_codon:yes gene_type:complete